MIRKLVARCFLRAAPAALALMLAGCVTAMETPDGSAGVAVFGTSFSTPVGGPAGCAGRIADFQAVIDSDEETGNLNTPVYRRAVADLDGVKAACAAGHVGEADSRLAAVKARYGYH
jgi:hypothetical protein